APAHPPPYTLSLHDALPISQIFAISGLAEIGDDRAIDPLIRALKDTTLRTAAAAALSKMGHRIAAPLLAAMKSETDSNILFHARSEEHTSELQSRSELVCRL